MSEAAFKILYEDQVSGSRDRLAESWAVTALQRQETDPILLEAFLIQFSSFGVGMTEPVENWIRTAGMRCVEIGLVELGQSLQLHARHEKGHHELMVSDTRILVGRWNALGRRPLDADDLIARPFPAGVDRYRRLHETTIAGAAPYAQLGIEYEIEALSVRLGPQLIGRCLQSLDVGVMSGLSFIREHVEADVGHTIFNRRELVRLLDTHPDFAGPLVTAGNAALDAYSAFLDNCWSAAIGAGSLETAR